MIDSLPLLSPTAGPALAPVPAVVGSNDGDLFAGATASAAAPSFGETLGQFLDARDPTAAPSLSNSLSRAGQDPAADGKDLPPASGADEAPPTPSTLPMWLRDAVATTSGDGAVTPDDTVTSDADPVATTPEPTSRRRAAARPTPAPTADPRVDLAATPATGASSAKKADASRSPERRAAAKDPAPEAVLLPVIVANAPAPVAEKTAPADAASVSVSDAAGIAVPPSVSGSSKIASVAPANLIPIPGEASDENLPPHTAANVIAPASVSRAPLLAGTPRDAAAATPQLRSASTRPVAALPQPIARGEAASAQPVSQPTAPAIVAGAALDPSAAPTPRATDNATAQTATSPVPVADTRADPATTVSTVPQPAGQVFAAAIATAWRDRSRPVTLDLADAATMLATTPVAVREQAVVHAAADAQGTPLDLTKDTGLQRMVDHIETLRDGADANDTRVRLTPDALGSVDVAVRQEGDRVHVRFTAEQDATRALIADAQPRLTELAAARGVRIGDTSVGGGNGQSASGNAPTPQPRPVPQPARAPRSVAPDTSITTDQRLA